MEIDTVTGRDRITAEEYGRGLQDIYRKQSALPVGMRDPADTLADQEFSLLIDHLLGKNFSPLRRTLLVEVNRASRTQMKILANRFLTALFAPRRHARQVADLHHRLMVAYSTILKPDDFKAFTATNSPDSECEMVRADLIPVH